MNQETEDLVARLHAGKGKETPTRWARYPVEFEPIRRWCRMVDWNNPLYLDPDFGKKTKWGSCLCPPLMIPLFAGGSQSAQSDWPMATPSRDGLLPPMPDRGTLGIGEEFEFHCPVRVGDFLGHKRRLAEVSVRPTRFDPESIWLVIETVFLNKHMETVAVLRGSSVRYRNLAPKTNQRAQTYQAPPAPASKLPVEPQPATGPISFEDVSEGQEIPGYALLLDRMRFCLQTSGSDFFGLVHIDEEFARSRGLPTVFLDAVFLKAVLCRAVIDWAGEDGWLQRFSYQIRKSTYMGDTLTVRGKVSKKYLDGGLAFVDCEVWGENQREGVAVPGRATVVLSTRE